MYGIVANSTHDNTTAAAPTHRTTRWRRFYTTRAWWWASVGIYLFIFFLSVNTTARFPSDVFNGRGDVSFITTDGKRNRPPCTDTTFFRPKNIRVMNDNKKKKKRRNKSPDWNSIKNSNAGFVVAVCPKFFTS